MSAVALITFWQLAGVVLPLVGAVALASFLLWCLVGLVLWVSKRGLDESVHPATDPEWFESL
jgi:hypothetical protein